jgi:cytochrome c553
MPMMHLNRWLAISLACGGALGCYGLFDTTNGNNNNNNNNPTYDGGLPGDLPCDVAQAISTCLACHGSTPTQNAPIALASYADLTAVASDGRTEAEHAVDRMNGTPSPMPPAPASAPAASDIAAIQSWIAAGYPQGTCQTTDPYNTPTVCTSGQSGSGGGSPFMLPGQPCIACHQTTGGEAPIYRFMGTVYPTAHEPDNCIGAGSVQYSGVQVIVTDAQGKTFTMTPNLTGNFLGPNSGSPVMPYTAKVTYQGRERVMSTPQTSGDCNSCHTEQGNSNAPGRIMLP